MRNSLYTGLLLLSSVLLASAQQDDEFLPGRLSVKLSSFNTASHGKMANNFIMLDSSVINKYKITDIQQLFPKGKYFQLFYEIEFSNHLLAEELIAELESKASIEFAEKIPVIKGAGQIENSNNQWFYKNIPTYLWEFDPGILNEVTIAVIDDGFRLTHEDLQNSIWINKDEIPNNGKDDDNNGFIDDYRGYDVADNDNDPGCASDATDDWRSHGTHVAGLAAATTGNEVGIKCIGGLKVNFMPVKVCKNTDQEKFMTAAYKGIMYAVENKAKIINLSYTHPTKTQTQESIIKIAVDAGILLIAAAGNEGLDRSFYPAAFDGVLCVGAIDNFDRKWEKSNYGKGFIDVMAPGVNIYSTVAGSDNSYKISSGTSQAAPIVASLAALMWSLKPYLNAEQIKDIIIINCRKIDSKNVPELTGKLGAGAIDVERTINTVQFINAVGNILDPSQLNVYPNPSQGNFTIRLHSSSKEISSLKIYNQLGELVREFDPERIEQEIIVNGLSKGIYFLKMSDINQQTAVRKIIVF